MLERSPYFIGAVALHLIVFLMAATWVIFKAPPPPVPDSFQMVRVAIPPPPAPPAPSGGEAANNFEPAPVSVPPPAAPTIVQAHTAQNFNLSPVKLPEIALTSLQHEAGAALADSGATGSATGVGSAFGSASSAASLFTGYFYDFKQSSDHTPVPMNVNIEQALLRDFFKDGWNEDDLAHKFLKSHVPLSTNQILVPIQSSGTGPKSFGMDSECKPGYWAVIYHATITPSHSGNYRLAGVGDDFLVVRINGDIALDSGYYAPVTSFNAIRSIPPDWYKPYLNPALPSYGTIKVGKAFRVSPGEALSIDIFIGDAEDESGTGLCGYSLFLLEDGKEYAKNPAGAPVLPLLQIQQENVQRTGKFPPYTCNPEDALTN